MTEVKRLAKKVIVEPLTPEDLRRLESLTRSWKAYFGAEIDEAGEDLKEYSLDELRKLAGDED